jgi:hypothetical protein
MTSTVLLAVCGIGAQGISLNGRVVSSNGGKPLDSVIVRLLASDTSVYSDKNGKYSFGGTVGVVPGQDRNSARTWSLSNGRLLLQGAPLHATATLVDHHGRTIKTTRIDKTEVSGNLDLSDAVTIGKSSGVFTLVISSDGSGDRESRILTILSGKVASMSEGRVPSVALPVEIPQAVSAPRAFATADTLHLWKPGYLAKTVVVSNLTDVLADITLDTSTTAQAAPVPLFKDPLCNGAADPTILWNAHDKAYWIFYTNRRATCCPGCTGVQWVFGTDIGVASTFDGGKTWKYRGIAKQTGKKDLSWNTSQNTFWAPEIIYDKTTQLYHMYASITPGILSGWNEGIANVVHLSAKDPLNGWSYDVLPFKSIHGGIDPTVHKLDDGKWYMWMKNRDRMSSTDLVNWTLAGTFAAQSGEAPYVFYWKGYYWMIQDPTVTDNNAGLTVMRSTDGSNWQSQANILGGSGTRAGEIGVDGKHCSVVVQSDKAYVIYFAEGGSNPTGSVLQAAPLAVSAAGVLTANRDAPFELSLRRYDDPKNLGR